MTEYHWKRVEELFAAALEVPREQRTSYVRERADDSVIRAEVLSLLQADGVRGRLDSIADRLGAPSPAILAASLPAVLSGRYCIERELGRGGTATVYLAHDQKHDRKVALKIFQPELARAIRAERFAHEIQIAAKLTHLHIVPLHDSGEADGILYYVMPYVEGESLRDRLNHGEQMPLDDALRIARDVAAALSYAHSHRVVHRDIKPENILLAPGGEAVVADFGIARALSAAGGETVPETGATMGTPVYMSPEQGSGGEVDGRSDIYSLGCVFYEMLAGHPPFTGATVREVIARHAHEAIPSLELTRPDVAPGLAPAIRKAMAKRPADRFATADEFVAALTCAAVDGRQTLQMTHGALEVHVPPKRRPAALGMIGLLIVLSSAGAVWHLRQPGAPAATTAPVSAAAIAVLPFADLSPAKDNEYFSDGVTEELINALGRVDGLRVAARTSSFALKGRGLDAREIGDMLDVTTVLEGSVRKSGNRLRVFAQLVDARTGYHLWSETYERELEDVFAVQGEITRAIVGALRVQLTQSPGAQHVRRATESFEAYELYLRGRYFWNKRTKEGLERAVEHFAEAIKIDPRFALAYAGMADAHVLLGGPSYNYLAPSVAYSRAKLAARTAIEFDSTLAEPHATLGLAAANYDWDWPRAEQELQRAIQLNPGYATAHLWYTNYLAAVGRLDEAARQIERARELDPLSLIIAVEAGEVSFLRARYDRALSELRKARELDANFPRARVVTAMVLLKQGKNQQAILELEGLAESFGGYTDAVRGYAYARAGRTAEARRILEQLEERSRHEPVPAIFVALVHTGLGDVDGALAWLEKGYRDRSGPMRDLKVHPLLDPLRTDPRFTRLLRRMGLADSEFTG